MGPPVWIATLRRRDKLVGNAPRTKQAPAQAREESKIMPDAPRLHLTTSLQEGVLVLTITDRQVEGEEVPEAIRQEMLSAVEQTGVTKVVVNFANTRLISSAAFRPLLAVRRKLLESGGRLVLCGLSPVIGDVFYTTRMMDATGSASAPFELKDDVPSAVAYLNSFAV